MQFCPKCGSLLIPKKEDEGRTTSCNCGFVQKSRQNILIKEKVKLRKLDTVEVVDKKIETNPTVKEECPKCRHATAYYWTVQTRAGDEAETRFFECVKCQNRWRAYE